MEPISPIAPIKPIRPIGITNPSHPIRSTGLVGLAGGLLLTIGATAAAGAELQSRSALRAEVYSGNRDLDDGGAVPALSLWTQGQRDEGAWGLRWHAALWAQGPSTPQGRARVRELNGRWNWGAFTWRAGRLMPSWGRADGLNPTDNLVPRDLRQLTPEWDDQRRGRDGLQLDWTSDDGRSRWTALALSSRAAHRLPLPRALAVPDGVEQGPTRIDAALKWDHRGPAVDASLSYTRAQDLTPYLAWASRAAVAAPPAWRRVQGRQAVWGADFSWQREGWVWRGEVARSTPSIDPAQAVPGRRRPQWWAVVGPEWSSSPWTLSVQGVVQHVVGFRTPAGPAAPLERLQAVLAQQASRRQGGLTLRVAHRALNDSLQSELSVLSLWPQGPRFTASRPQGLLRLKTEWALDDSWTLSAGLDRPFGPAQSYFGAWRDNPLCWLQWRRHF